MSSEAGCLDSNTFDACDDPTTTSQIYSAPVVDRREQRLTNDNEHCDASNEEEKQDEQDPPKSCYSKAMTWPILCIPDGINLLTRAYDESIQAYSTPSLKAYSTSSEADLQAGSRIFPLLSGSCYNPLCV